MLVQNQNRTKFDNFFNRPLIVTEVSENKALLKLDLTESARFTELSNCVSTARTKKLVNQGLAMNLSGGVCCPEPL